MTYSFFSPLVRCPPLMDIVLHMLNGYLLASKAYLQCHLKETADFDRLTQANSNLVVPGQPDVPEVTREELKNALLAAQVIKLVAQFHTTYIYDFLLKNLCFVLRPWVER